MLAIVSRCVVACTEINTGASHATSTPCQLDRERTTPRSPPRKRINVMAWYDSLTSPATLPQMLMLARRRTSMHACDGIVVRPTSRTTSSAGELDVGNGGR